MRKIIYDFGANNGDDIPYYLLKADLVVAVEANPVLCKFLSERFHSEIAAGRVVLENCVVSAADNEVEVEFYIHRKNHVLSQFPRPSPDLKKNFKKVSLLAKSVSRLVAEHGPPHYIKIDIEHYDAPLLRALWCEDILPPYISAESHSIEVFALLVSMGYTGFKLVDGPTVQDVYSNRKIEGAQGTAIHSFPAHAAGPFGEDVDGPWMVADDFFQLLAQEGLGWKDIHGCRLETTKGSVFSSLKEFVAKVSGR